jgi:hypothetical protein
LPGDPPVIVIKIAATNSSATNAAPVVRFLLDMLDMLDMLTMLHFKVRYQGKTGSGNGACFHDDPGPGEVPAASSRVGKASDTAIQRMAIAG